MIGQLPKVDLVEQARVRSGLVRTFDSNFLIVDWQGQVESVTRESVDGWIRFTVNRNTLDLTFELFERTGDRPPSGTAITANRGSCSLDRPRF
jgi:hypothetical protein